MSREKGYFWKDRIAQKAKLLRDNPEMIHNFRSNGLSGGIDLSVRGGDGPRSAVVTESAWKNFFPDGIPDYLLHVAEESTVGGVHAYEVQGIMASPASLKYAYIVMNLEPYLWKNMVVWEIGSGFGGQARALLLTGRVKKYILQDYPPHLELSKYFLLHPPESGYDFLPFSYDNLEFIDINRNPWTAPDLILNTHSMMEMSREEIEHYFIFINNAPSGALFYHMNFDKGSDIAVNNYPFDNNWEKVFAKGCPGCMDGINLGSHWLYRRLA